MSSATTKFDINTILSDDIKKKRLQGFIEEATMYKREITKANDGVKDIRKEAKDALGIPPKIFNALVKLELTGEDNIDAQIEQLSDVQELAKALEA